METYIIRALLGVIISIFLGLIWYVVRNKDKSFDVLTVKFDEMLAGQNDLKLGLAVLKETITSAKAMMKTVDRLEKDLDEHFVRLREVERWSKVLRNKSHYFANEFMRLASYGIEKDDGTEYQPNQIPGEG